MGLLRGHPTHLVAMIAYGLTNVYKRKDGRRDNVLLLYPASHGTIGGYGQQAAKSTVDFVRVLVRIWTRCLWYLPCSSGAQCLCCYGQGLPEGLLAVTGPAYMCCCSKCEPRHKCCFGSCWQGGAA
jgi:hypothetical protein